MLVSIILALAIQHTPSDTTVSVRSDTRLEVAPSAGTIDVDVWDRSAVRVVARTERGAVVTAELDGGVLRVRARTPDGSIGLVAYQITVPRRMSLTLGRGDVDVDITIRGTQGSVDATIAAGSIAVEGGRGMVSLRSFRGPLEVRGARATVNAESATGAIELHDVVGDVTVTSNANQLTLEGVDSRNLRARSIAGAIRFSGPLHQDGRYSLTSHSGSVFVSSPMPINATVAVATVGGAFTSALPYSVTERRRESDFTARFGDGGAQVSLETFNGRISVEARRPM